MPRPFTRGRVRPSNYPNISWRMLHTYYRNNWKLLKDNCYLAKKKDVTTANLQIGVNLKQRTLDILIPLQFFFNHKIQFKEVYRVLSVFAVCRLDRLHFFSILFIFTICLVTISMQAIFRKEKKKWEGLGFLYQNQFKNLFKRKVLFTSTGLFFT